MKSLYGCNQITNINNQRSQINLQRVREAATICPARPLQVDLWPLTIWPWVKVVSESRVTWATYVPILVFLGLSVLDLGSMYETDRRQTSDTHHCLMPPTLGAGHNKPKRHLVNTSAVDKGQSNHHTQTVWVILLTTHKCTHTDTHTHTHRERERERERDPVDT